MDQEVDVSECTFTVTEDGKEIWKGEDYKHAFFLKGIDPKRRKVFVNAKVDVTLDAMSEMMTNLQEQDETDNS